MTTFNLTANELAAARVLVQECLNGMGGKRPSDLDNDPYTWCYADTLIAAGWSKEAAAGTYGSLAEKGFIDLDKDGDAVTTDAYQYMDTIWDAQTETSEMENTVTTTAFVALIDLSNLTVAFAADHPAETDLYTAGSAPELEDLTGPQAVAIYNVLVKELNDAPARVGQDPIPETKRFADKGTATKRVWGLIEQVQALRGDAPAPAKKEVLTQDDKAQIAAAKNIPAPAAAKAPRRGTGINLAPLKVAYACRAGSKQATLVDMLFRPEGATMVELLEATSGGKTPWKEVSVKSGLNWDMNKIKGYGIKTTKRGDDDCYHLVLPAGLTAPIPHTVKKGA